MLNFVVCEDNKIILQKNVDIINKFMFDNEMDYKVHSFSSYCNELKKLISKKNGNYIYILDIELDEISGIDIAKEIRNLDFESIIIISTSYMDYLPYTIKSKLMILDFVSKFEDYEKNLICAISKAYEIYKKKSKYIRNLQKKKIRS